MTGRRRAPSSATTGQPGLSRLESVDLFRLLATLAVIVIHTSPFAGGAQPDNATYKLLDVLFDQSSRFAVPFFFVLSGYFWGAKVRKGTSPMTAARQTGWRILVIFAAWSLIYLLLPLDYSVLLDSGAPGPLAALWQNAVAIARDPATLFWQGTKLHLWYLVALLFALFTSAALLSLGRPWLFAAVAIGLYVIGVLGKSYADTPIGFDIGFNTRNGPFFGTLLFATGYWLSGVQATPRWALYGLLLFAVGYLVHFSEIFAIWKLYGRNPKAHDYTFGTYLMGVGFAVAALSNHPKLRSRMVGSLGQMTLGIYAVHFVFVDLLYPIDRINHHPLWELGYPLLVLVLAMLAAGGLSKNHLSRKLVV